MPLILALLLSVVWIGALHAEGTVFYDKKVVDKYWAVMGVARDSGQTTCFGEVTLKDGSFIQIHRSLVDGEVWAVVHSTAWEMNPTGGDTLRWNFFGGGNVNGADLKYSVKDKNTILILGIVEKWFFEAIRNSLYFTLVMPNNLKNVTFAFEKTGSPMLAALTECVRQNEKSGKNPERAKNPYLGLPATDAPAGDGIEGTLNIWEKRLIQEGLILLGYYNGLAEGTFGKGTREAIAKFQTEKNRPATGTLTPVDAVTLGVTALQVQEKIGWRPLENSRTKISMSYPAALLTKRQNSDMGGETIDTADGKLSLMTIQVANAASNGMDILYRALTERFSARITYQLRRPDYFIVSGTGNGQTFYARAELRGSEIRGYDLIWRDDDKAQLSQNISVLVSSYFYPFGGDPAQGKPTYPTLTELIKIAAKGDSKGDSADNRGQSGQSSGTGGKADNDQKGITEQNEGALPPPGDGSLVTSDGKGLRFVFRYTPPSNPDLQFAFHWASESHLFSSIHEINALDGTLVLPRQLNYVAAQCGAVSAFYTPKLSSVVLCYEMIASLEKMGVALSKGMSDPKAFVNEFVRDNVRFILVHETGHALIDLLDLPAVGREEDSVDQLATILLLMKIDDGESKNAKARVLQLASTWFKVNSSQSNPDMAAFSDEHSLDAQRYYNMLCIAYGLDKDQYNGLVSKGLLPQARAERCGDEATRINRSWLRLLIPHFAPRYAKKSEASAGTGNNSASPSQTEKNPLEWDQKSNPFGD